VGGAWVIKCIFISWTDQFRFNSKNHLIKRQIWRRHCMKAHH
jgi:hypothetical protein